jgi:hypothetical protein
MFYKAQSWRHVVVNCPDCKGEGQTPEHELDPNFTPYIKINQALRDGTPVILYWGGGGRKIMSSRPAWATQQEPVSK